MTNLEVLIIESAAVDGLTTSTVAIGEVSTLWMKGTRDNPYLAHELGNDSVHLAVLVAERLAALAISLLTSAEATEVLGGLGNDISEQL